MTTTGVAKFHRLVQSLRPEIIICEEAAEVLECHIVSALGPNTRHLILIGDHEQLRPSTGKSMHASFITDSVSCIQVGNALPFRRVSF